MLKVTQEEIDQLYHLMRKVSNEEGPSYIEQPGVFIAGLARHLFGGGDYLALLQYLDWYGDTFLRVNVNEYIESMDWKFNRVVEFGAGLSWLSLGIASHFGIEYYTIDKRPWGGVKRVLDLETPEGRTAALHGMHDDDIIVMSDFIHCVKDPAEIIDTFSKWKMIILEYAPFDDDMWDSYNTQLKRHGADPMTSSSWLTFVGSIKRKHTVIAFDPYEMVVIQEE